jgi:hypothetical protein
MVILTDKNPRWRPSRYVAGQFPVPSEPGGQQSGDPSSKKRRQRYLDERTLRFLTVKLIDFRGREAELEAMDNPMGLFLVAHLEALRTRNDAQASEEVKLRLIRNLRQRKMDLEDTRLWLDCLDWFLQLPPERERALGQKLERLDKEENMPFVNFIERHALEKGEVKGRLEGRLETLRAYLKAKFGDDALTWLPAAEKMRDEAQLTDLCASVFQADSAEKVRSLLAEAGNGAPPQA